MSLAKSLLVLGIVFCCSCKSKVEKIKPEIAGITESIYASGIVKSQNQYQAYPTVNGIIKEIFVTEGDTIKKNAPILSIVNDAQQLSRQNAELAAQFSDVTANSGKLNDAKLSIDLARNKMKNDSLLFSRQSSLWQQNIGTKVELEQRQLSYQNSRNTYQAAIVGYQDLQRQINFTAAQSRNNLQISSKQAGDYTIRSTLDGVVYELPRKQGEIVGIQTPVALIGDASHFKLEMQVDEYDILQIKNAMPVKVTMDSYKGKVFDARVTKINPLMNDRSKTFLVEAEFTNGPEKLYPNITFEANIIIQAKDKALLIPRNYLLNDSTVLKSNGDKVTVKTGLKDYRKIEIVSGISADDELKQPAQ